MAGSAVAQAPVIHRPRGVVRIEAAITCDASGVMTAVVIGEAWGRIVNVFYDGGLDASAVLTVSDSRTGATLFAYTTGTEGTPAAFRPTTPIVGADGAAIAAADTAPNINRAVKVAGKISLAVASGGTSETGILALVIDEANIVDPALTV